jgi:hypothetical protein
VRGNTAPARGNAAPARGQFATLFLPSFVAFSSPSCAVVRRCRAVEHRPGGGSIRGVSSPSFVAVVFSSPSNEFAMCAVE